MSDAGLPLLPAAIAPRAFRVAPRLLAGPYPGALDPREHDERLRALLGLGVTDVVTLMEADETNHSGVPFRPYAATLQAAGVDVQRFAIRDVSTPSAETVVAVLDAIDGALAAGGTVYVHCWGGRGRTGVIVGCWLVRHGLAAPAGAVGALQRLRASCVDGDVHLPDTAEQARRIAMWTRNR
jgi:protein-tyrosine phosphatase